MNPCPAPAAPSLHFDALDALDAEPSWAHASGWAQISGTRRTVSCVLTCSNQASTLAGLLPFLSDTLTECGYPWEVIVVDIASIDRTRAQLEKWTALPGFQTLELRAGAASGNALASGLHRARGDAVIVLDAVLLHDPGLIPRMIMKWEDQARIVFARREPHTGKSQLVSWNDAEARRHAGGPNFRLPRDAAALCLLDRSLLAGLMRAR
jgi:glycosyltransferase involved in cell wall biosynthesis